ncbi:MAG TPA: type I secretion C-terminal target domain-containing protein, partial [Micavibrio sp.]
DDKLRGEAGDDSLRGGDGNDSLGGGEGVDDARGGIGNDVIYGDGGNDTLYGDEGNDRLYGGAGTDKMTGGTGRDGFIFDASTLGSNDKITDFSLAEHDYLKLDHILVGFDPLHDAIGDFVTLTTTGTHSMLSVDIDGALNGHSYQAISIISNLTGVNATDFYAHGMITVV